jgi:hypothetical protein
MDLLPNSVRPLKKMGRKEGVNSDTGKGIWLMGFIYIYEIE